MGTSNPRIARGDDCALFRELSTGSKEKDEQIDFSGLRTIQYAERGISDIAEEIYKEVSARSAFFASSLVASKEGSIWKERGWAILTLTSFLAISAVISLTIGGIFISELLSIGESTPVSYWLGAGYTFIFLVGPSVLAGLWRGYLDLYPRAAFRYWWKIKDKKRDAIEVDEVVDYLIDQLEDGNLNIFASVYYPVFLQRGQKLLDRRSHLRTAEEKAGELSDTNTMYADIQSEIQHRIEVLDACMKDITQKKNKMGETISDVVNNRLPHYRQEAKQAGALISELSKSKSGRSSFSISSIRKKRLQSRRKLTDKILSISQLLKEADRMTQKALKEDDGRKKAEEQSSGKARPETVA